MLIFDNMDSLFSNFVTDEVVISWPYQYLAERGNRNSKKKTTYWIDLLENLNKMDPKLTF